MPEPLARAERDTYPDGGDGRPASALTCPLGELTPDCDCDPLAHHRWNCRTTPIWAQTMRELDINPWTCAAAYLADYPRGGVRLTEQEREQVRRRAARRRNEARALHEKTWERAHEAWRRGLIIPRNITAALDIRSLDGPEVDAQCGVEEPAVDMWEAAELYPTWDQLVALSKLTEFPLSFFHTAHARIDGAGHMCGPRGCRSIPPDTSPTRYPRNVVAECPGTEWFPDDETGGAR